MSQWKILNQGVLSDLHFKVIVAAVLRRLKSAWVKSGNRQDAMTLIMCKMTLEPSGSGGHHERWPCCGSSERPRALIGRLVTHQVLGLGSWKEEMDKGILGFEICSVCS